MQGGSVEAAGNLKLELKGTAGTATFKESSRFGSIYGSTEIDAGSKNVLTEQLAEIFAGNSILITAGDFINVARLRSGVDFTTQDPDTGLHPFRLLADPSIEGLTEIILTGVFSNKTGASIEAAGNLEIRSPGGITFMDDSSALSSEGDIILNADSSSLMLGEDKDSGVFVEAGNNILITASDFTNVASLRSGVDFAFKELVDLLQVGDFTGFPGSLGNTFTLQELVRVLYKPATMFQYSRAMELIDAGASANLEDPLSSDARNILLDLLQAGTKPQYLRTLTDLTSDGTEDLAKITQGLITIDLSGVFTNLAGNTLEDPINPGETIIESGGSIAAAGNLEFTTTAHDVIGDAAIFEDNSRFSSVFGAVHIDVGMAADILVQDFAIITSNFLDRLGNIKILHARNLVMAASLMGGGDIDISLQGNYDAVDPSSEGRAGILIAGGDVNVKALSGSVNLGRISDYKIQGAFAIESQSVEMTEDLFLPGGGFSIITTGADGISIGSVKSALGTIRLEAKGAGNVLVSGDLFAYSGAVDVSSSIGRVEIEGKVSALGDITLGDRTTAAVKVSRSISSYQGAIQIDIDGSIDLANVFAYGKEFNVVRSGDILKNLYRAKKNSDGSIVTDSNGNPVLEDIQFDYGSGLEGLRDPSTQTRTAVNVADANVILRAGDAIVAGRVEARGGALDIDAGTNIVLGLAKADGKITIDATLGIDIQGDVASANDIVQITARGGDLSLGALEAKGAGSFLEALGTTVDPDHPGLQIEGVVNILDDAGIGGDLRLVSNRGIEIAASVTAAGEIHFTSSEDLAFEEAVTSTGGAVTLISTAGNIRSVEGISASNALSLTAEESIRIHSATSTNANVELSVTKTGTLTGIQGLLSVLGDIIADGGCGLMLKDRLLCEELRVVEQVEEELL